jgi:geranylgeranyl diphosphate synthase type 3
MQSFSSDKRDYIPLVNQLAVYFQVRDDLLNLLSYDQLNKSFCEDLTEGKYSFPIIHAILSNPTDHRMISTPMAPPTLRLAVHSQLFVP